MGQDAGAGAGAEYLDSMTFVSVVTALVALVVTVLAVVVRRRKEQAESPKPDTLEVGQFISELRAVYDEHGTPPPEGGPVGELNDKQLVQAFWLGLKLRPSQLHVKELCRQSWLPDAAGALGAARAANGTVGLGDFALFVEEITGIKAGLDSMPRRKMPRRRTGLGRKRSLLSLSGEPNRPAPRGKYQVFLGGSCNPTTWRKDLAIPCLNNAGVTYYNPQVDDWRPELVELEEQAKETSEILFFVIDNQTRGIGSMVELAYLAGTGRDIMVVMLDFEKGMEIGGRMLTDREIKDLTRGHDFLCSILQREGVPVFEDTDTALRYMTNIIRTGRRLKDLQNDDHVMVPVFRGLCLTTGIFTAHNTFSQYDLNGAGVLSMRTAQLALKSYFGLEVPPAKITTIMDAAGLSNGITRDGFCCIVADLLDSMRKSPRKSFGEIAKSKNAYTDHHSDSDDPTEMDAMARDIFLGGSCSVGGAGNGGVNWRSDIAIPILRKEGLSFYDPDVPGWTPRLIPIEHEAKAKCKVLLFFIASDSRSIASLVEAAHYIGEGTRQVVLCINDVTPGAVISGDTIDAMEAKDLNRGRFYLQECATRCNIQVFTTVKEATEACVQLATTMKRRRSSTVLNSSTSGSDKEQQMHRVIERYSHVTS